MTGADEAAVIADYLSDVVDAKSGVVNPDLIHPGDKIDLPAVGADSGAVAGGDAPAEFSVDASPDAAAAAVPEVEAPLADGDDSAPASSVPWVVGISGVPIAATGLWAVWRALRRRRRALSASLVSSEPLSGLEAALVGAADVPLVRWASQELALLVMSLPQETKLAGPEAVELTDAGRELLWDRPQPVAPMPWEPADAGRSWRLAFDPDAAVPVEALAAGIPGLVTIGQRDDGGQVLVDLEAYGSLSVTGDPVAVESVLRSMVIELGSCDDVSNVFVTVLSSQFNGAEHLSRVRTRNDHDALDRLRSTTAAWDKMIESCGSPASGSFGVRAGEEPHLETVVTVISETDDVDVDAYLTAVRPRCGTAVIVGGEHDTPATLHVGADGTATFMPLGIEVTVSAMPRQTASEIAAVFDYLASIDTVVVDDAEIWAKAVEAFEVSIAGADVLIELPGDVVADARQSGLVDDDGVINLSSTGGDLRGDDNPDWHYPDPEMLVTVLGRPSCADAPSLSTRGLSLIAFVASNGHGVTRRQLIDALWAGKEVEAKIVTNLVSEVRGAIGQDLLPRSVRGSDVVKISDSVRTDMDIFTEVVREAAGPSSSARELELLSYAIDMVHGVPFDGAGFEWAHQGQQFDVATQMIEATALRLVELATEAQDLELARHAVVQGLRALGPNKPLYRARMCTEADTGNTAGVVDAYQELAAQLATHFDDGEPSEQTRNLRQRLLAQTPR